MLLHRLFLNADLCFSSDSPLGVNGTYIKGDDVMIRNGLIVISQCCLLLNILAMLGVVLPGQELFATAIQLLTCRFHPRQPEQPARRKPAPQRQPSPTQV